jgi:late competence protein required for DNA uptake (superfamily II DNA/RNA helicase)
MTEHHYQCADCQRHDTELTHCYSIDTYLCEECIITRAVEHLDRAIARLKSDPKEPS